MYFLLIVVGLVVSTSAIDCLERLVSEMICYVLSGMITATHSVTARSADQLG